MRKSDVEYDVDSEDVVAHTEILARQILFNLEGENGEKVGPNIPRAADLLQAILSSETLKDAVIKLISKVMDSEEFQTSAKELVRNLWNDLVEDPETTAQVVHLLNHAIQTVEIQNAAQELVIKVVNDKDVFDELIQLLNRIGQEHQVRHFK
jgi:glycerol-3-phosphate O-acyltransferase